MKILFNMLLFVGIFVFIFTNKTASQPINNYAIFGGGSYCVGDQGPRIGLAGSDAHCTYELVFNDTFSVFNGLQGTGDTLYFGYHSTQGTYSIVAYANGVSDTMDSTVSVIRVQRPTIFEISGGGFFCEGTLGPEIFLSGSQASVVYDILVGGNTFLGSFAGSGFGLSLGNFNSSGTYTVRGRRTSIPACPTLMNGSASVEEVNLPQQFTLSGDGIYCPNGQGAVLCLSSSETGVIYTLTNDQNVGVSQLQGTGDSLFFPAINSASSYTVMGEQLAVSGCKQTMIGSVQVQELVQNNYTLSGGGVFCEGSAGGTVLLTGSQVGFNYFIDNLLTDPFILPIEGSGSTLVWDSIFVPGEYVVYSQYALPPFCQVQMNGSVDLVYQSLPQPFSLTGGGYFCEGQPGAPIGLEGSEVGVNYLLILNDVISAEQLTGDGDSIDFGFFEVSGTYTVQAEILGCTTVFDDEITVEMTDCTGNDDLTKNIIPIITSNYIIFPAAVYKAEILSITGATVSVFQSPDLILLETFVKGIYFLKLNERFYQKFVVQ